MEASKETVNSVHQILKKLIRPILIKTLKV